ncbi:hypothetical protein VC83_02430 [Pseudogymnoascus destructans]|uniref:Uncharacterized protein n=1 Tax=Pseudogymnoascus destructans TaxID=655981 RepID=A0A177AG71_9PEZI|nr:uncharacterized protein VC83_02430 [Pseudogymnoascus destructans]OAF60820.1 hypothetical protein VC83_02430 [Pseudogymnoascus destructans]
MSNTHQRPLFRAYNPRPTSPSEEELKSTAIMGNSSSSQTANRKSSTVCPSPARAPSQAAETSVAPTPSSKTWGTGSRIRMEGASNVGTTSSSIAETGLWMTGTTIRAVMMGSFALLAQMALCGFVP